MSSALLNEVASAKSFFSLIASDGPMHDQVVKNFADALIWQVNNCLVMTLHDATLLIHALKENPYADADIKRITAAIAAARKISFLSFVDTIISTQRGMFPCLRAGRVSSFSSKAPRARVRTVLV